MRRPCGAYCSHGGVCTLERGHLEEKHDASGVCQWTDEESVSKEQADEVFLLEAQYQGIGELGEFIITMGDILEKRIDEEE